MATGETIRHADIIEPGNAFEVTTNGAKEYLELKKQIIALNKKSNGNGSEYKTMSDAQKQVTDSTKELLKMKQAELRLREQMAAAATDEGKRIQDSTYALKEETKEQKAAQRERLAAAGSMARLSAELSRNKLEYQKLSAEERNNTKEGRNLLKTIQQQDKELKKLNATMGQHQAEVGNYSSAWRGMGTQLLAVTGITAGLAGGFKIFKEVIASTNLGMDRFTFNLGGLKESMSFLARSISTLDFSNLIQGFRDAYHEGYRYAEALGDIDDLQGALGLQKKDIESEIYRQRIIAKTLSNDLSVREAAVNRIIELEQQKLDETQKLNNRILDNVLTNAESITKVNRAVIVDYIKNSDQYTDELGRVAELEKQIQKDATTYYTNRQTGMQVATTDVNKYNEAVSKLSETEQYLLEIYKLDKALTGTKDTGVRGDVTKALNLQVDATNEQLAATESLARLRSRLYNELIRQNEGQIVSEQKITTAYISTAEDSLQATQKVVDATKHLFDEKKATVEESFAREEELLEKELDMFLDAEKQKQEAIKETAKLEQQLEDVKIGIMNQVFEIGQDLAEKNSNEQKAMAIAQATINAYLAASQTLADWKTALDPISKSIAALATLGIGLGLVGQIVKVSKFAEGTEYVDDPNAPRGKDTIPSMVNIGERIVPTDINRQLSGIPNEDLPGLTRIGLMFQDELPGLSNIARGQLAEQQKTNKLLRRLHWVAPDGSIWDLEGNIKRYVN